VVAGGNDFEYTTFMKSWIYSKKENDWLLVTNTVNIGDVVESSDITANWQTEDTWKSEFVPKGKTGYQSYQSILNGGIAGPGGTYHIHITSVSFD